MSRRLDSNPTARADLQAALLNLMTDMPRLALVLSSHIFEDIERVTDEIIIIRDGHLVFQGDVDSLAKGGTTVAELYHATEHLCKPGKP